MVTECWALIADDGELMRRVHGGVVLLFLELCADSVHLSMALLVHSLLTDSALVSLLSQAPDKLVTV